jgi:hypothetical protein
MTLLCTKESVYNLFFTFPLPVGSVPSPPHLTSCTPNKSNLYVEISSATAWVNLPWHSKNQTSYPFSFAYVVIQRIRLGPRFLVIFRNSLFLGKELFGPLEDHPLSAVRDCLFNILTATLRIWSASPPSATWGRTMPRWQGPTWHGKDGTCCTNLYSRISTEDKEGEETKEKMNGSQCCRWSVYIKH